MDPRLRVNSCENSLHHHHHHHHPHHTIRLTWCKHNSTSGPRYKVSVTHVVSVRRSGKTDTSSAQYGMKRRLTLTLRSLVGRCKPGRRRPETHGLPVLHDVSPARSALTTKTTAGVDVTGCPSLVESCQQGRPVKVGRSIAVQTLVYECTELELYPLRHSQPMKLLQQRRNMVRLYVML